MLEIAASRSRCLAGDIFWASTAAAFSKGISAFSAFSGVFGGIVNRLDAVVVNWRNEYRNGSKGSMFGVGLGAFRNLDHGSKPFPKRLVRLSLCFGTDQRNLQQPLP